MTKSKQLTKRNSLSYLLTGSLVVVFMLLVPYAFYIYNYFPDEESYKIGSFVFESNYYESVRTFVYFIVTKLVPLILLLIWFTTCKHWWYYSIGIPIAVYVFQLGGVINDDVQFNDGYEFVYSLPITLLILVILFFLRSKIGIYLKAKDIKKEMDEQMNKPFVRKGE